LSYGDTDDTDDETPRRRRHRHRRSPSAAAVNGNGNLMERFFNEKVQVTCKTKNNTTIICILYVGIFENVRQSAIFQRKWALQHNIFQSKKLNLLYVQGVLK